MTYTLKQLRRLRLSVLAVVLTGIGVSVAMNILHAPDSPIARGVAAGPPIALYAALEMITRIPSSGRWPTVIRIGGAAIIASGAAIISYAQQKAAVAALGFAEWESYIWPLIVDGLMLVASVSLVEVVRLIRKASMPPAATQPASSHRGAPLGEVAESPEVLAYRLAQSKRRSEGTLQGLTFKPVTAKPRERSHG